MVRCTRKPRSVLSKLAGASLLVLLCSCVAPPPIRSEADVRAALPFIVPGETTCAALTARYGTPAWASEDRHIVSWALQRDDGGNVSPRMGTKSWGRPWYCDLIVTFDGNGLVARFNLVELE